MIIKKDEKLYYIQEMSCKDGYMVTEIPYKHITLELLEEMQEETIRNFVENKGMTKQNAIETLLRGCNAKPEIIYFEKNGRD